MSLGNKPAEIAILLHQLIPQWKPLAVASFVQELIELENKLTILNQEMWDFYLKTNDYSFPDNARNKAIIRAKVREHIFNSNLGHLLPVTFHTNPDEPAIRINVGKRLSNDPDGESLTFKIK